ncbi:MULTISPECIES: hypothetical protein [unclassified Rhodococcus (in: high G+C Gram-positive bacteria)]|uniref:hypothetical protein n=1 Tax=unclassified Rhodococcus (in: high G+C Gram-positive bacteria) TaxID=192944 RepID=UPI0033991710
MGGVARNLGKTMQKEVRAAFDVVEPVIETGEVDMAGATGGDAMVVVPVNTWTP